MGLTRGA